MSKRKLALLVICLTVVCVGFLAIRKKCKPWGCWDFNGQDGFALKETYFKTNTSFRGLFSNTAFLMRVDKRVLLDSENPKNEHNARTMRFSEMFTKAPAPYPGDISDVIVCPDNMIPQKKEVAIAKGKLIYFVAHYGKRLNFGICSLSDAEGIGVYAVLYCEKDRSIQQVEFFQTDYTKGEEKASENMARSILCEE